MQEVQFAQEQAFPGNSPWLQAGSSSDARVPISAGVGTSWQCQPGVGRGGQAGHRAGVSEVTSWGMEGLVWKG